MHRRCRSNLRVFLGVQKRTLLQIVSGVRTVSSSGPRMPAIIRQLYQYHESLGRSWQDAQKAHYHLPLIFVNFITDVALKMQQKWVSNSVFLDGHELGGI